MNHYLIIQESADKNPGRTIYVGEGVIENWKEKITEYSKEKNYHVYAIAVNGLKVAPGIEIKTYAEIPWHFGRKQLTLTDDESSITMNLDRKARDGLVKILKNMKVEDTFNLHPNQQS